MPQCIHGWGWDGIGPNTCPQCNTPENVRAHAAVSERFDVVRKLREWATRIETGHASAPVKTDPVRVEVLRQAAESLEKGEDDPQWAR